MTDAISSMEYPHWLIVVGVVLLTLGFIGLSLRPKQEMANGNEQGRADIAEFAPQPNTRKARLAEQKEKQAKIDGTDESAEHPGN